MNYVKRSQELISDDGFVQRYHETVFVGLKRCPKCGSSVHSKAVNIDDLPVEIRADYIDAGDDFYMVKCEACGRHTRPFATIEEAASEWNSKS
ncbi:MAG: hypothetical protein IJP54_06025 [Synergistaceae bacterium]|nr:hypothetical protein [Synergistaceae bacterium]MBR0035213.1 hypothetical protein [Synergistaceae bacterium]